MILGGSRQVPRTHLDPFGGQVAFGFRVDVHPDPKVINPVVERFRHTGISFESLRLQYPEDLQHP